ncbi:hypothetical protein IRY44_02070 [Micromonospora sp. ANENR4]|uniref:hypothetical protein n=1 Tax=Micromonospora sp. ANENR4 TaxID=2783662 RepID=UPI00188F18AE|nr:hypothetical protein [Micromonospora sp. ANENR4]MBF5028515.1 hypothetical protein [Micromonospora sp. ANENR4]
MPRIIVRRALDTGGLLRRIAIEIDGKVVARLNRGAVQSVDVTPGRHVVRAHLDWQSSAPVDLHLADTETIALETALAERSMRFTATVLQPGSGLDLQAV